MKNDEKISNMQAEIADMKQEIADIKKGDVRVSGLMRKPIGEQIDFGSLIDAIRATP